MSENISDIDYKQVIEYALEPLIIHSQLKIIYVNRAAEIFFKASKEEIIGASPLDIFKESSKSAIDKRIQNAYERPANVIEETIYRMDGTTVEVELYCHPVLMGNTKAIQTYVRDITERKAAEKKQKEMISQINELSSTLVPLLDEFAVLPLLGVFDEERARQLLERVPANVQKQRIKCLIIDFSAIYNLDSLVAEYIFKISTVLSLLGVRSIITGLRPELALVAVQLGINFNSTPTVSTVKAALDLLGIEYNKDSSIQTENK
ncbi:PAS domain S-box protein [Pseudobacillus wudalianchiensis]|uniref:Histidine kinase n=1 Tax=Pseudobacillus wudalianchiensis TaxID=1743143 RepID=A0A1B9ADQ9_9BACI|nr:PAS domain S-box protein [Bacillus wudalianchiensis]OCA81977.1 histidine kinase [Bacillus wudalianchiensis]